MEHYDETGTIELKKTGLTDQIIEYLGLDITTTKRKWTPTEDTSLVKEEDR